MDLTKLLGISLPIIQAPMAGVQGSALALAVSNAGGLGSLPCATLAPDVLRKELTALKSGTRFPFNVNFFCHTPPAPNEAAEARWREALAPYYHEFGLDPGAIPAGPGRRPFDEASAALVEEFRPAVVSFHFGLPEKNLLARVQATGAKVFGCATTVEEGTWLHENGADAIIAQGAEAGGHRGMFLSRDSATQIGIRVLMKQLLGALRIPVIAAGGIADAEGVREMMALGAAGVQVGTAYLLCPEATTSEIHRRAIQSAGAGETALTNLFTGRLARGIVNRLMRELGPVSDLPPEFPLASAALAPLKAKAEATGSGDFTNLWAGENTRGCRAIAAAELTRGLAAKIGGGKESVT